jgi:hypothetical protein
MTARQPLFMLLMAALALGAVGAEAANPTEAQICEAFENTYAVRWRSPSESRSQVRVQIDQGSAEEQFDACCRSHTVAVAPAVLMFLFVSPKKPCTQR